MLQKEKFNGRVWIFPLLEIEFQKVKKSSINFIKKDKENPFNICFENWRRIVYSNHPYAFNTNGNANDVPKITHEDVLLELQVVDGASLSSDTNKDVGIIMNYYSGSAKKAAVFWDDSVGRIVVLSLIHI